MSFGLKTFILQHLPAWASKRQSDLKKAVRTWDTTDTSFLANQNCLQHWRKREHYLETLDIISSKCEWVATGVGRGHRLGARQRPAVAEEPVANANTGVGQTHHELSWAVHTVSPQLWTSSVHLLVCFSEWSVRLFFWTSNSWFFVCLFVFNLCAVGTWAGK